MNLPSLFRAQIQQLTRSFPLAILVALFCPVFPVAHGAKDLPLPGEEFTVEGKSAFLISAPSTPKASSRPWVWYAPTLPGLPGTEETWMFERFLTNGIAIAGIDVGESYGSPAGNQLFSRFHSEMVSRGFSPKPLLLGRSRGGLMLLSWALENPARVAAFAGIYPVCNLTSYPGIDKAAPAYALTPDELHARLPELNPVDRTNGLAALAKARVPLFAIHGDSDKLIPLEANSGLFKQRYESVGGSMELIVPPGQGHNMWSGFFQSPELVDFLKAHARPALTLQSPTEFQVIQRASASKGRVPVRGTFTHPDPRRVVVEARLLLVAPAQDKWRRLSFNTKTGAFDGTLSAPAGGWYQLQVRARLRDEILAETQVEHVGLGEIFVVAGQSNSANHGEERQQTHTGLISAFDGNQWQLANDPQPGASGNAGSFMPPFADAMAQRFGVPIGIVACGVGATSVREWLPEGTVFSRPPTLTGHVRQLPNGDWESKGTLYNAFSERLKSLGPRGFRAILWHQGESDANQPDPARTLPGDLYRQYMQTLIRSSRNEIGWKAPWFVALASYHTPSDDGSPDIRAAQASLAEDGFAIKGPDTDALTGELRDNHGQGVHFSGPGLRQHALLWAEKVGHWLEEKIN